MIQGVVRMHDYVRAKCAECRRPLMGIERTDGPRDTAITPAAPKPSHNTC